MRFVGTVNDTLRYIVASNNVVLDAFPSYRYSVSLVNETLALSINSELYPEYILSETFSLAFVCCQLLKVRNMSIPI